MVATVALSCAAAGCQSQSGPTGASGSGADKATPSTASTAKPIDACSMLSAQDVSSILGVSVSGKPGAPKDPRMGGCTWQNTSTEESITLEISQPGTALHNTLPPPEAGFPNPAKPGPDGMRLLGNGTVEFAAGNRDNTLQVAVLRLSADQANSAAIELARKVVPQVPQ
ncbi:hypothetical protein [Mycobacterium sp. 852002-40037_SCH5390672]|uniref:hypothetical protein n=1 Tax=Mycobacterium sp. 852002-40037_SCH5390672 TaxID=1834089 RepID=UPI0018D3D8B7|nr:hypothetical protein [Mycobacterium sp. 852002-40037_SCH5390672]